MKLFRRKQHTALEQIQQQAQKDARVIQDMGAQLDELTAQLLNRNAQTVAQLSK